MKLHFKEPHAEVISTKLGTKYHLIKSAQVCLNSGPVPYHKKEIENIHVPVVKIDCEVFKIFFFRTTEPVLTKVGTMHPLVKGLQFVELGHEQKSWLNDSLNCLSLFFAMI